MKNILKLAFQFNVLKTWDPFHGQEEPRSVVMTPQRILVAGSNQGNLVFSDTKTDRFWKKNLDKFPVYFLQASPHLVVASTTTDKSFLLDSSGNLLHKFQWQNVTMFQSATEDGTFLRLSSNHWLSCWRKGKEFSIHLPLPHSAHVVAGTVFGNILFFLTLDQVLWIFVWKDHDDVTTENISINVNMEPTNPNIPTFLDVIRSNETPLRYKVLVGGTCHTYVHEVDMIGKKLFSSIRVSGNSQKGCFLPNEHFALQTKDKVLCKTKTSLTNEWNINLDDSSQFQFFSPCLITNNHNTIFISKLEL